MSTNTTSTATIVRNNNSSSSNNGGSSRDGPCGACKFLRRKCVEGCVFAPYFDSEQGTAHFAAVHRVFGASNASKLLLRVPADDAQRRLEAVVTLCYEAIARVRDPVYGCVAHIFALQQQVVKLQAELACVQARISTLQQFHLPLLQHCYDSPLPSPSVPYNYYTCSQMSPCGNQNGSKLIIYEEEESTSKEMASSTFDDVVEQQLEEEADDDDDDLFNVTP